MLTFYLFITKACGCLCGRGHLRKDTDCPLNNKYNKTTMTTSSNNNKPNTATTAAILLLNQQMRNRANSLSSTGSTASSSTSGSSSPPELAPSSVPVFRPALKAERERYDCTHLSGESSILLNLF